MAGRNLADWLRHQETLSPRAIDLGLDRVVRVLARLPVERPRGGVFTVAGTNGKGSTTRILEQVLLRSGLRAALYSSPHLLRYNERVRVDGLPATDAELCAAFARVDEARGDVPLTYFEFGTLAALVCFTARRCDAWVLEVGLGGRLDAVNAVDPDRSLITTIGLDHQEWLGETLEAIAAEKAGILRAGRAAYYGDQPVPAAILSRAREVGAPLACLGDAFRYEVAADAWDWHGHGRSVTGLRRPPHWSPAQFRNASLALAALADHGAPALDDVRQLDRAIADAAVPGRFQLVIREHQWVIDVAHNPQAAAVLRAQLATLPPAPTTAVISLLADKSVTGFVSELAGCASHWIVAPVDDPRTSSLARLEADLVGAGARDPERAASPAAAFARAAAITPAGGRIVVTGSFRIAAPALEWLGLY